MIILVGAVLAVFLLVVAILNLIPLLPILVVLVLVALAIKVISAHLALIMLPIAGGLIWALAHRRSYPDPPDRQEPPHLYPPDEAR